jgi:hypothetical protein
LVLGGVFWLRFCPEEERLRPYPCIFPADPAAVYEKLFVPASWLAVKLAPEEELFDPKR